MSMTHPSSGQPLRSGPGPAADGISDLNGADEPRRDGLGETVSQLSRDIASVKDSLALLASQVGGEAAKAVRSVSQSVTSQVGSVTSQVGDAASGAAGTGADLAASAKEHVKTFASELEATARRNPLGTIAATLVVGIVIGMMSRGRG